MEGDKSTRKRTAARRVNRSMVISALNTLKKPSGLTYADIQKFIIENFHINTNFINLQIRNIVEFLLDRKEVTEMQSARRFKLNQHRKIEYKSNSSQLMVRRPALDKKPAPQTRQTDAKNKIRKEKDLAKKNDGLRGNKLGRPRALTEENGEFDQSSPKQEVPKNKAGRKTNKNE